MDKITQGSLAHLLPKEIYLHFGLSSMEEKSCGIEFRLEEYAELLQPESSRVNEIVLDGFCNQVEPSYF
jgi:hypothetical protein